MCELCLYTVQARIDAKAAVEAAQQKAKLKAEQEAKEAEETAKRETEEAMIAYQAKVAREVSSDESAIGGSRQVGVWRGACCASASRVRGAYDLVSWVKWVKSWLGGVACPQEEDAKQAQEREAQAQVVLEAEGEAAKAAYLAKQEERAPPAPAPAVSAERPIRPPYIS